MSTEAKVGGFVIVSILVLAVTIYSVHATQTIRGQVSYKTYFRYAGGLAPGSYVLFGGITVGQVAVVQPWSEDPTLIEIVFRVKTGTPVNEKSTAEVGTVSIMSSPALSLTTGSKDARRLAAGQVVRSQEVVSLEDVTQRVSVLADSANKLIVELQTSVSPLARQAQAVLANLNEISGPQNQKEIQRILAQVNTLFEQQSPKVDQITTQVSSLAKRLDSVAGSLEPFIANADRTVTNVNTTLDAVRDPAKRDLVELERTIQQARMLLGSMQDLVRANQDDASEMVGNLRAVSENLRVLTESVNQRPWSLVRIKQPPDRKVPK
jgi:phospholipid/cholesterol/gamma-HCH transport system substrate-binding protein